MEALERLLLERFLTECDVSIPETFAQIAQEPDSPTIDDVCVAFIKKYEEFKQSVLDGKLGKTPQFWLVLYLDLMRTQNCTHIAVHDNNLDLRYYCYKFFLPLYFALHKTNYARYSSYYVKMLENMEVLYPGLKDLLSEKGIQAQERFPLRVLVDQRGEQTLNHDEKTTGGIKYFAADSSAVLKWTLNCSEQAKNTGALLNLTDMNNPGSIYKPLSPSQILKSERFVSNIINVLKEKYVNPFDSNLDKELLVNLSSGIVVAEDVAEEITSTDGSGKDDYQTFCKDRIESKKVSFHDPISRKKLTLFSSTGQTVSVEKDKKLKSVEVNRNILGLLLSTSAKSGQVIDFAKALEYPLSPVSLSLANPDGSSRVTSKSKLLKVILKHCNNSQILHPRESQPLRQVVSTVVIDMMACLRTMTQIPDTYEELTWKFFKLLPQGYERIDIVADTYHEVSLKSAERSQRGKASKVVIRSAKSKIPRNFSDFLKNGENKKRLIILMRDTIIENKVKALDLVNCGELYFSTDNDCRRITQSLSVREESLVSNQEEADTKLVLHSLHALNESPRKKVIVRSPSGDTDVLVILLSKMIGHQDKIYLDYGTGLNRKGLWLSNVVMSESKLKALIGFHAFTGNDYISSFFRKDKPACWKI